MYRNVTKLSFAGLAASVLSAVLVFSAVPSYADHLTGHDSVARDGIKSLDERLWTLEQARPRTDSSINDLQSQIDDLSDSSPAIITVDCDGGGNLQTAIDGAKEGDTIQVSGTCNERVIITTDGINLDGGGAFDASLTFMDGATIDGTTTTTTRRSVVSIEADKVVVHGFIIQNSASNGFHVRRAGSAWIYGNLIRDNPTSGINANQGSYVRIGASGSSHSEIGTAGAEGNIIEVNGNGINASANTEIRVSHNIIRNNTRDGITLSEGVGARIDANQVTGNGDDGIEIKRLAIIRTGTDTNHGVGRPAGDANNLVQGNGDDGLLCTGPAFWFGMLPNFGIGNGGTDFVTTCFE